MLKWVTIFAASVAWAAFLLIGARYLLPVMGLAGVEGETVQPLIKLMPWVALAGAVAVALLLFSRKRQAAAPAHPEARRLVEEAEDWSDNFLVGAELAGNFAPTTPVVESKTAERETSAPTIASTSPIVAPILARAADSGRLRPPRVSAHSTNPPADELLINHYGSTRPSGNGQPSINGAHGRPVCQLPPVPYEFVGRAFELAELLAARANPEIKILGLQGLGGVGKTALAVRLAHQLAAHYPAAQIFVDLKGTSAQALSVAAAQAHVIRAYLPTGRLPESEGELRQLYQGVLADKRVLLLLDNAVNAQQIAPLVPPAHCLLVVTSREHISLPGMFSSRLESLSPAEACEMLQRLLPPITQDVAPIAERCGYLPFALRLAASALTQHAGKSVGHYTRQLARVQEEDARRPIEAALSLSYELLVPGLRTLWRTLAVFPDSFEINAAAAVWQIHPQHAANALQRLLAYGLIERDCATGRFRLHDILRSLGEARLLDTERVVTAQRHAAHFQSLLHEADALYEQGGAFLQQGLDLVDLEWHNLQAGQVWAAGHLDDDRTACELCNSFPNAGRYVLDLRQHPRERIRWSEAGLAAARVLKRRKAAAKHLITLGDSYADLSEVPQAIACYEQALALMRDCREQGGAAAALLGLGRAYRLRGALQRAREYQESALQIAQAAGHQRLVRRALGTLGLTHHALGNPRRALELFEEQLQRARTRGDWRDESQALGGLGAAHCARGEWARAIELLNEQLTITRKIGDRPGESSALTNLGTAHTAAGHVRRAIELFQQACDITGQVGDTPGQAQALLNLSRALAQQGDRDHAVTQAERALELFEMAAHPAAETVRRQLANWQQPGSVKHVRAGR